MLRRFFKLIAGSLLTLVGIAILIEAIRFNRPVTMSATNSWDPISEFLLCVGVVVGGYGAYLAYSGWNPQAASKFLKEHSPSPLAGEGGGEGEGRGFSSSASSAKSAPPPLPNPLPQGEREPEKAPQSPDIGLQP